MKKKMMTAAFLAALLLTACGSTGTVDSIAENGEFVNQNSVTGTECVCV